MAWTENTGERPMRPDPQLRPNLEQFLAANPGLTVAQPPYDPQRAPQQQAIQRSIARAVDRCGGIALQADRSGEKREVPHQFVDPRLRSTLAKRGQPSTPNELDAWLRTDGTTEPRDRMRLCLMAFAGNIRALTAACQQAEEAADVDDDEDARILRRLKRTSDLLDEHVQLHAPIPQQRVQARAETEYDRKVRELQASWARDLAYLKRMLRPGPTQVPRPREAFPRYVERRRGGTRIANITASADGTVLRWER